MSRTPRPKGWPRRMADWVGFRVRTREFMINGFGLMPRGSIAYIDGYGGGVSLVGIPCRCCGLALRVGGVDPTDLELLHGPDPEHAADVVKRVGRCREFYQRSAARRRRGRRP